jgi:protein farnesyltransferase/geranylgeranyltransferase type-1 subunit alpha
MGGSAVDLPPDTDSDAAPWPTRTTPLEQDTPTPVPLALEFLADALLEQGSKDQAAKVFAQLGGEVDRMRAAYWDMRRQECL